MDAIYIYKNNTLLFHRWFHLHQEESPVNTISFQLRHLYDNNVQD